MKRLLKKTKLNFRFLIGISVLAFFVYIIFAPVSFAKFGDCPAGYTFKPNSGIGCVQTYCLEVQYAKYSYEGRCICGSSGSETENIKDANKECFLPASDTSCPGCLVKCVFLDEKCPGEFGVKEERSEAPGPSGFYGMVEDAFSKFMSIGTDLLEAATGIIVKEDIDADAFYQSLVILPAGDSFDARLFHNNSVWNENGTYALEFNVLEIKPHTRNAWIDEWSIGVGIGSVSQDGVSHDVPGTPVSPGVNFNNIQRWFSEQYTDVSSWWRDNAPWFLGGGEKSPIPGMNN